MTRVFKPSLDVQWHLAFNHDDTYRLTPDGEDAWDGSIADDEGADEVLDLTTEASLYGWRYARDLADHLVEVHNADWWLKHNASLPEADDGSDDCQMRMDLR